MAAPLAALGAAAGSSGFDKAGELLNGITMAGINFGLGQYSSSKAARRAYKQFKDAYQHRHQWEVEDLKKAGLNPILSAHAGGTAQGFMAQAPATDVADAMAKGASSALARKQAEAVDSNIMLAMANAAKAVQETEESANRVAVANDTLAEQKLNWSTERGLKVGLTMQSEAQRAYLKAKTSSVPYEQAHLFSLARQLDASAKASLATAALTNQKYNFYQQNPDMMMAESRGRAFGPYFNNMHYALEAGELGTGLLVKKLGSFIDNWLTGGRSYKPSKYPTNDRTGASGW